MLPYLPLELQLMILHQLGSDDPRYLWLDRGKRTFLARCCLVCQAWKPVAQKYLQESVVLKSGKHMKQFVSPKFNPSEPIRLDTKGLKIYSKKQFNERPFHHLVPYYTARKLSCLEMLTFVGSEREGTKDVFPVSTQFTMHLSHFQHVTSLYLHDFQFQTFWDLRRFVVALPVLSFLDMDGITWPQFSRELGRVPSLPFIARNLQKICFARSSVSAEVLWFWVTTHKAHSLEHQKMAGCPAENQYPAFTIGDAATIGKFIDQLEVPAYETLSFVWKYSREKQCYNFDIRFIFTDHLISFDFKLLVFEATLGPRKNYLPPHREFQIGRICSFKTNHNMYRDSRLYTKSCVAVDKLCNSLEDLQEVQIPEEPLWRTGILPGSLRHTLRQTAALFPQIQARARRGLSLTIVMNIDGSDQRYSWDPGMENDDGVDEEDEVDEETYG